MFKAFDNKAPKKQELHDPVYTAHLSDISWKWGVVAFVGAALGTLTCFAWCVLHFCVPLVLPCSQCPDAEPTLQAHMPRLMHSLLLSFAHLPLSEAPFNIPAAFGL